MTRNLIFLLLGISILGISSCGKYEDGPMFSLLSKKHRLCTVWGGMEESFLGPIEFPYELEFMRDGFFEERNASLFLTEEGLEGGRLTGVWEFVQDKEAVQLTFDSGEVFEIQINRLTRNDLWFEFAPSPGALMDVKMTRDRD